MTDIVEGELCPFGCRCQEAAEEIKRLRADNDALRAALEEIAQWSQAYPWVGQIARSALEG